MDKKSRLRIAAKLKNLSVIRRFVQEGVAALDADPDRVSDMLLAMNEAAANIIVHGYQGQPGMIEVEAGRTGDSLVVCLRDQATLFDPTGLPPPDLALPLERRPFGGMGIYLMRQLVDEVTYRITPQGGNELTLVKEGVFDNS